MEAEDGHSEQCSAVLDVIKSSLMIVWLFRIPRNHLAVGDLALTRRMEMVSWSIYRRCWWDQVAERADQMTPPGQVKKSIFYTEKSLNEPLTGRNSTHTTTLLCS